MNSEKSRGTELISLSRFPRDPHPNDNDWGLTKLCLISFKAQFKEISNFAKYVSPSMAESPSLKNILGCVGG